MALVRSEPFSEALIAWIADTGTVDGERVILSLWLSNWEWEARRHQSVTGMSVNNARRVCIDASSSTLSSSSSSSSLSSSLSEQQQQHILLSAVMKDLTTKLFSIYPFIHQCVYNPAGRTYGRDRWSHECCARALFSCLPCTLFTPGTYHSVHCTSNCKQPRMTLLVVSVLHCEAKKMHPYCFCNNFVKPHNIFIIFGTDTLVNSQQNSNKIDHLSWRPVLTLPCETKRTVSQFVRDSSSKSFKSHDSYIS